MKFTFQEGEIDKKKPHNNNIVILKANCNSKSDGQKSPNQEDMEMRELAKKLLVEQQMKKLEHSPEG